MTSPSVSIGLLRGDGIGPEIAEAVVQILDAAKCNINWVELPAGEQSIKATNEPLPKSTIEEIRKLGTALKGPIGTPIGHGYRSVNVTLRQELDLYANFRPIKSLPGVKTRFENVDLVIIRENTEGLYAGLEHEIVPGVVTSLKVATRRACLRIAEFAFNYAEYSGRKLVTAIHKANILKLSDGLALECYREVAEQHPTIKYDERIVDATAMGLVLNPSNYDILLTENLYGDILSDLGAALIGGLGLASSGNFGPNVAVFESVHGSAPDIAGQGIANPTALLLSAVAMLRHLGKKEEANRIQEALESTLSKGTTVTRDLGGKASTREFAGAVIANLS